MKMNDYKGKKFLAAVRESDYAHAGEEDAIEITLSGIPKNQNYSILDVGCGRGGTAHYVKEHGWGNVVGIDVDEESIAYAKQKYPDSKFYMCGAETASEVVSEQFDVIYFLNVLYAVGDRPKALKSLRKLAKPDSLICLFDYFSYQPEKFPKDILSRSPSTLDELNQLFDSGGWKIETLSNLDQEYIDWYSEFLARFTRPELHKTYDENEIKAVRAKYQSLLDSLETKVLGGVLIVSRAV
jgi:SAM-dependent methyltransferase